MRSDFPISAKGIRQSRVASIGHADGSAENFKVAHYPAPCAGAIT
jgi:hypothetical protein